MGATARAEGARVIGLQETHLEETIPLSETYLEGFRELRQCRSGRKKGGVSLYLKDTLSVVKRAGFSNGFVDILVVGVEDLDTTFSNVYRSPATNYKQWKEGIEWLEKQILEDPRDQMMLGDLNFKDMGSWSEIEVERMRNKALNGTKQEGRDVTGQELLLLGLTEGSNLRQIVRGPTRGNHILDLVFGN